MMNVSSWSIRNPIPAVMIFVLLTLAGIFVPVENGRTFLILDFANDHGQCLVAGRLARSA